MSLVTVSLVTKSRCDGVTFGEFGLATRGALTLAV